MWIWKQLAKGGAALVKGDGSRIGLMVDKDGNGPLKYSDVTITAAQLNALHATPQVVVPAPHTGLANIFHGAVLFYQKNTTAFTVGAADDLSFKYTDANGLELGQCETTGFLDQATNQTRYARAETAASGNSAITPVANAPIVLNTLSGELSAGDGFLKVRVYYRTIPTTL